MAEYLAREPADSQELMTLTHGSSHVYIEMIRGKIGFVVRLSTCNSCHTNSLSLFRNCIIRIFVDTLSQLSLDQIAQIVSLLSGNLINRTNRIVTSFVLTHF